MNAGQALAARQDITAGLRFGQATARGLALANVERNSLFYNSGLRPGDVLVSYAGRPIRTHADFTRWAIYQPGQRVPVVVLREGRPQTIYVVYHQHQGIDQRHGLEHRVGYAPSGAYLGVTFDQRVSHQAVVSRVAPGSPAERAGVQPRDVIVAINGQPVSNSQHVIQVVSTQQPGDEIDISISRRVRLEARPGVAQASNYSSPGQPNYVPNVPAPASGAVEAGVYQETGPVTTTRPVDGNRGVNSYNNNAVRPADADGDGRALDGDGRAPRARVFGGARRR